MAEASSLQHERENTSAKESSRHLLGFEGVEFCSVGVWAPEQKEGKGNEYCVPQELDVKLAWLCQRSTNPLEWLLAAGITGVLFWGQAVGSNCLHSRDHC